MLTVKKAGVNRFLQIPIACSPVLRSSIVDQPNRSPLTGYTQALLSERGRPRPPPSNRCPLTGDTQALLSERGRPRPPPSNRTHHPLTHERFFVGGFHLSGRGAGVRR